MQAKTINSSYGAITVYLKEKISFPSIQVALDLTDAPKALEIASYARNLDNTLIEAGTPLLKSEGAKIIGMLKAVSGAPVVADMKTIDAAELEVQIAGRWGADIVTVLGVADDATIKKALEAALKENIDVQCDLISVRNPLERAIELVGMGVKIIGFHAGIDVQKAKQQRADTFLNSVRQLRKTVGDKTIISVAGGIKPEEVASFVDAGADIIVIGSAITSAPNPLQELKKAVSFIL